METTVNFSKCCIPHIVLDLKKNLCKNVIFSKIMHLDIKSIQGQIYVQMKQ